MSHGRNAAQQANLVDERECKLKGTSANGDVGLLETVDNDSAVALNGIGAVRILDRAQKCVERDVSARRL